MIKVGRKWCTISKESKLVIYPLLVSVIIMFDERLGFGSIKYYIE